MKSLREALWVGFIILHHEVVHILPQLFSRLNQCLCFKCDAPIAAFGVPQCFAGSAEPRAFLTRFSFRDLFDLFLAQSSQGVASMSMRCVYVHAQKIIKMKFHDRAHRTQIICQHFCPFLSWISRPEISTNTTVFCRPHEANRSNHPLPIIPIPFMEPGPWPHGGGSRSPSWRPPLGSCSRAPSGSSPARTEVCCCALVLATSWQKQKTICYL